MDGAAKAQPKSAAGKVKPNDPCSCNSGKKVSLSAALSLSTADPQRSIAHCGCRACFVGCRPRSAASIPARSKRAQTTLGWRDRRQWKPPGAANASVLPCDGMRRQRAPRRATLVRLACPQQLPNPFARFQFQSYVARVEVNRMRDCMRTSKRRAEEQCEAKGRAAYGGEAGAGVTRLKKDGRPPIDFGCSPQTATACLRLLPLPQMPQQPVVAVQRSPRLPLV